MNYGHWTVESLPHHTPSAMIVIPFNASNCASKVISTYHGVLRNAMHNAMHTIIKGIHRGIG